MLSADFVSTKKRCQEFEMKLTQIQDELTTQENLKNNIEQTLTEKLCHLEVQINEVGLHVYIRNYTSKIKIFYYTMKLYNNIII